MPLQDLLDWIEANPFSPFRIFLTNGISYDVHAPHQIWPGKQSVLLGFPSSTDPRVYEKHMTVGLLHIANIEPIETSGRKSRKR